MDNAARAALASAAWDMCKSALPVNLRNSVEVLKGDPSALRKYNDELDIVRIRICPVERRPKKFWDTNFCFYEIGVGQYQSALCLGMVQWLQFSNQLKCGHGMWKEQVLSILKEVATKRAEEFEVWEGDTHVQPNIKRAYFAKPHKNFPPKLSGEDMAWLIEETLPKFQRLHRHQVREL